MHSEPIRVQQLVGDVIEGEIVEAYGFRAITDHER
jgi:hypothetical protein